MPRRTPPRTLDYVRVEDLPPDPTNSKGHADAVIQVSISEHGFIEPIVIDERTGLVLSGHGRREQLIALEQAGADLPDGLMLDTEKRWLAPLVRGVRSRDDEHAKAMSIMLNRAGEVGGWRPDELVLRLQELDRAGVPLEHAGYSSAQLADMLVTLGPPPSLDHLRQQHGEPRPEDFWPVLRLTLPPEVKARFDVLTADVEGDELAKFCALLDRVEVAA